MAPVSETSALKTIDASKLLIPSSAQPNIETLTYDGSAPPEKARKTNVERPSGQAVAQAARKLDIDLVFDADLLYIAEEFLLAPLPQGWEEFVDEEKRTYYHHSESSTTQWSHPLEEYYRGAIFMRKEGDALLEEKARVSPPTPEEVCEMAKYFGVNPRKEVQMMGIAKIAVNAPLPPEWEEYEDDDGEVYFYNRLTKKTSEHHPLDGYFVELIRQQRIELKNKQGDGDELAGAPPRHRLADFHLYNESFVPAPWMHFTDAKTGESYYYDFSRNEAAYVHPSILVRHSLYLQAVLLLQAIARGNAVRRANRCLVEELAASSIQRLFRGHRARKETTKLRNKPLDDAATRIQAAFRGKVCRQDMDERRQQSAVLLIQSIWRGLAERRRRRNLQQPLRGVGEVAGSALADSPALFVSPLMSALDQFALYHPPTDKPAELPIDEARIAARSDRAAIGKATKPKKSKK